MNDTRYSIQDRRQLAKSKIKKMVIIFSDSHRIVHKDFVPSGVTLNQKYYLEVLDRLRKRVMRVRTEIAED
jgi:hypothetical protein